VVAGKQGSLMHFIMSGSFWNILLLLLVHGRLCKVCKGRCWTDMVQQKNW
jgi:hypothetical protein